MYSGLKHAHSGLRWVVLALIIAAIINALMKASSKEYTASDKKLGTFALIATHIQVLLGIVLYFISPMVTFGEGWMKNAASRFYGMEHLVMMLLAAVVITIGNAKAKRATTSADKFKKTWIFYLIGLVIIFAGIPWPFRGIGGGWY